MNMTLDFWMWIHIAIGGVASLIFLYQTLGSANSGMEADFDSPDADVDTDAAHDATGAHSLSDFLSVRNFVAFFVGYGWVTFASSLSGNSRALSSFLGGASGMVFVLASFFMLRTFLKFQEDGGVKLENLTGVHASVYITIGASMSSPGKVFVDTKEGRMELSARTPDGEALRPGQMVVVTGVDGGILTVSKKT
ncbi:MAG: NfeD family protein [Synergistaceae bacterium]|jgi:hypothetical protein|nr:NfeD family protein [Synergistaceae bacterium]